MLSILNPSGLKVITQTCGREVIFEPFQEKTQWDFNDKEEVLVLGKESHQVEGLVILNWKNANKAQYKNEIEYKKKRALEGLKKLYSAKREGWINERQANTEIMERSGRSGTEMDQDRINPERMKSKMDMVQKWIDELSASESFEDFVRKQTEPKEKDLEEVSVKKSLRGRPRKLSGSTDYQDQSAAQA